MAGNDRLSALSNDLLRRVLYFAPAKEAASTAALSSRWRETPLWPSSGAVNLEMRVGNYDYCSYESQRKLKEDRALFFSRRDAFLSAAVQALHAAVQVTRPTLRLEPDCKHDDPFSQFMCYDENWGWPQGDNAITVLLSRRAGSRSSGSWLMATKGYYPTTARSQVTWAPTRSPWILFRGRPSVCCYQLLGPLSAEESRGRAPTPDLATTGALLSVLAQNYGLASARLRKGQNIWTRNTSTNTTKTHTHVLVRRHGGVLLVEAE